MKLIFYFFFAFVPLFSQSNDSLFLRVVLPEKDTIKYNAPKHRIAASTNPTSKAFINDKEVKVYPSGAFISMANVSVGDNVVKIVVQNTDGDSLVRNFVIIRPEGIKTSPKDPITIESAMMQPSEDVWLSAGDILEVKMKGSPKQNPLFDIDGVESGIPMREVDSKKTGGVEGIYVGRYKVKESDQCVDVPIRFRIRKNFFSSEKVFSKGKISIIQDSLPRVAEVIGKRPFLNAGLGVDRLGGAKLGFLVPGVRVIVSGKIGDQYKVKLSDAMEAYLPQEYAQLQPIDATLPLTLVGNISVTGNDSIDVVSVSLGQKVPYTSEQLTDPMAIVVNIFGATSNTNWITHHLSAKEIQQVKCTQAGTDHYQLTIYLKAKQHWGYDISYDGTTMKIKIRRAPKIQNPNNMLEGLKIALDAGHGGKESLGALGATGAMEKNVTLSIAQHLQEMLQTKGVSVVMTRSSDMNVSMTQRTDTILASGAQLLVSIHANSTGEGSDAEQSKGVGIFYRHAGFKTLSDIMYEKMLELGLAQFGETGSFNFSLNAPTQLPNVLVETAFMSHPEDEMKLLDDNFRKQIAEKIVAGLEKFVASYADTR